MNEQEVDSMPDNSTADVFVSFGDGERALDVTCVINFKQPVAEFRFSLSTLLHIDSVVSETECDWETVREWTPPWQHNCHEYRVKSETPMRGMTVSYHGQVSGWCNIIENRRIALSGYSAWAMSATSIPVDFMFRLVNMADYFVINGRYDATEKIWSYGGTGHDVANIIALKNGHYRTARRDNFTFYYLENPEIESAMRDNSGADNYAGYYMKYQYYQCMLRRLCAERSSYYYGEIMRYYTSVFSAAGGNADTEPGKMDVVCLDMPNGGGAYFRKELIVLTQLDTPPDEAEFRRDTIGLLAHELGHTWFTGADTAVWEDWLNETGAEWAALLFILSLDEKAFFESQLEWPLKSYRNTPAIKPADMSRPAEGVHTRGTVLFYEIYKKYGAAVILRMLQTFVGLPVKDTAHFLAALRGDAVLNGNTLWAADGTTANDRGKRIADVIESGLTMTDYSGLLA
jgi:hypothetical protein